MATLIKTTTRKTMVTGYAFVAESLETMENDCQNEIVTHSDCDRAIHKGTITMDGSIYDVFKVNREWYPQLSHMTVDCCDAQTIMEILPKCRLVSFYTTGGSKRITAYHDTDSRRRVYELTIYRHSHNVEIRDYVDFDPIKSCWTNQAGSRDYRYEHKRGCIEIVKHFDAMFNATNSYQTMGNRNNFSAYWSDKNNRHELPNRR